MANTFFSHDFSANYPIVKAQGINTQFQLPQYMFWGRWMKKYTTLGKKAVVPNGSIPVNEVVNSPFVMHRELEKQAGDNIEIPIFREFKEIGKKGDEQLFNRTEERYLNFARVYINELRHGEKVRQGNMNTQRLKKYGIPESSRTGLGMQLAKRLNFLEIPYALYLKHSFSVLTDTKMFGNDANVARVSHPNFYVVGDGKVSYSSGYPGTAGYEGEVATALDTLDATKVISGSYLRALNADDQIRKIPYFVTKNGTKFRLLLLDPYGMAALRDDADIKAMNRTGFVDSMITKNPELTGMELFYEGWAIYDAGHAVYPLQTSGGIPLYGPTATADTFTNLDDFKSYSAYNKFGGIIIGDNAIAEASGWDLKWTGEMWDHEHIKEIGYSIGIGFSRPDYMNEDDGTTGQYLINDTSAIVAYFASVPTL